MLTSSAQEQDNFTSRLNRHPKLKSRFEKLLDVVENAEGDAVLADEAERRVIEELRQMGQESLQTWAERGTANATAEHESGWRSGGKKTLLAHHLRGN